MNQSILFNDDLHFDESRHAWVFTGLISGAQIRIYIDEKYHPRTLDVALDKKLDWEAAVEDWLEKFEPVSDEIILEFDD